MYMYPPVPHQLPSQLTTYKYTVSQVEFIFLATKRRSKSVVVSRVEEVNGIRYTVQYGNTCQQPQLSHATHRRGRLGRPDRDRHDRDAKLLSSTNHLHLHEL